MARLAKKVRDSDHSAHKQSIIRAFALHSYILQYTIIPLADSEGPYPTARILSADARRHVFAFRGPISPLMFLVYLYYFT